MADGVALEGVGKASLQPKRAAKAVTYLVIILALLADAVLLSAAVLDYAPILLLLAGHVGVVGLMALLLLRRLRTGSDGGFALLAIMGTLATGPFGAAGALLMPLLARRNADNEALLSAWYQRIALSAEQDAFTKLSDRVAIGRAANLAAPAPQPLFELFQSAQVSDQQTALGIIARSFHPGYLPVLKLALDSPEPVIRVQAAAVAARVRDQLNVHVRTLFARAADPTLLAATAVDVAAELRAAIDSGLLETAEYNTAVGVHDGLLARTFARIDAGQRQRGSEARERRGTEVDDAYVAYLLTQSRFDEVRAARLAVRRPVHGRYRHRLVRARPVTPNLKRILHSVAVSQ